MLLALIFVVPAFFPVTFPALETVAILLFIEVHVTLSPFAGFFSFIVVEFPVYTEIGVLEMLAIYLVAACTGTVIKNTIVKSIIANIVFFAFSFTLIFVISFATWQFFIYYQYDK